MERLKIILNYVAGLKNENELPLSSLLVNKALNAKGFTVEMHSLENKDSKLHIVKNSEQTVVALLEYYNYKEFKEQPTETINAIKKFFE